MKKFLRHKTLDEVLRQCRQQKVPTNTRAYAEGYDTVVIGQAWPLNTEDAYAIFNTCNGNFCGKTDKGVHFDSKYTTHEQEPWMQALLSFFLTDELRIVKDVQGAARPRKAAL